MVVGESRDSWISAIVSVIDSTRAGKGSGKTTFTPVCPTGKPKIPHCVITPSGPLLHPDLLFGQFAAPECPVVKLLISGTCPVSVPTFLVAGSALPVGVPVPWPSATPPTGWLKCNGAAFSAEEYPELAKAYPTNKLPDLRGEFIRGWDDGRGIDAVRALLSLQNGGVESHTHQGQLFRVSDYRTKEIPASEVMGRGYIASLTPGADSPLDFDDYSVSSNPNGYFVGNQRTTAYGTNETRPRNIAFNYIVRAA